jgi:TP901 family phage tail tape measure protein
LAKINARMRELRAGAAATGFSMNKLADEFNRYQTLGFAVIAMITSMGMAFGKLIGYNKDLEDQLANVRKTTGLTDAQVRELSQTLGTIDTRTSRMELLKLAEEAGRLGKESSEDILGFVRVADKLFVALGDDFGAGAEHSIRSVGKLTELFEIGQREGVGFEQAMEMLGSSINEVAASGATQASYLVDFLNRTAGIGRQAKISAQDFIGFAATLDEGAQSVEVSGTVMSNLISKMFKKTEEFATAANIPLETFKALLTKDVNEALLQFLQGVNRNQGGLQELVENMDGLGIDGQRATSVLGLLASSVDKVREKQALANNALQEGTSLQAEFTVKNENMAGNLEKIGKRLAAAFSFKGLNDALREASHWLAVFVGAVEDSGSKALKWRETLLFAAKAIGIAVVGLVSYKTAVALAGLWTDKLSAQLSLNTLAAKANAIGVRIADAAIHIFAAGQALLTGNITAATFAWRGFTAALAANPIGLLVTGITVAVTAFYAFRKEQEKVVSNSEKIQKSYREEMSSLAQNRAAINARLEVIKKANLTDEQRAKAMAKLRSEYKEYVPLLKDEAVTLKDVEGIQKRINARMGERMTLLREEMMWPPLKVKSSATRKSVLSWKRISTR